MAPQDEIAMLTLGRDLRIALRNMRTRPFFSGMAVALLALGVAGNAAIFSIFNSMFLRPLPFVESERLIDLDETAPKWNLEYVGVSAPDFYRWHSDNSTFESMAFFRRPSFNLSRGGTTEHVEAAQVTREMLEVLRLAPLIGRNFLPEEDRPGGSKVVLLNYGLWQRLFQGDRHVLGGVLKLDEEPYTIVGVLPREAVFPDRAELWTPLQAEPNTNTGYYLNGIGRLKPGVTLYQARADLLRVHKAMIAERKVNEITSPVLTPLRDRYLGDFRTISQGLLGAVGMVMLMSCVNIGALLMVRGSFRSREFAIRSAIGASRRRIMGQLLTENAVLAVAGGALGVLLAGACLRAAVPLISEELPQWIGFSLDARFVIFCVFITGAAVLLFGLVPALEASRVDIRGSLEDTTRSTARSRRTRFAAVVVAEVGLAMVVSITAALLLQSFRRVLQVDPGFRPENVLTFRVRVPDASYHEPEQKIEYYERLVARMRQLPGVRATGATSAPPLGGQWGGTFESEGGGSSDRSGENPTVLQVAVMPGYFDAIGMTLLSGRSFKPSDGMTDAPRPVLVNETFAKHFWGTENPLGKHVRRRGTKPWSEVIGLLRDEKHYGLDQEMRPSLFLPYRTALATADSGDARSLDEMTVVIRSSIDPRRLMASAPESARQLDPDVAIYAVQTMMEQLDRSVWPRRAYSLLFGAFALVALLLASTGVYGVLSHSINQRTREIGIRMALGARPGQVLREVLLGGMILVSIGIAGGVTGALWAAQLLRRLLFGVGSRDPLTYTSMALGVLGIGFLANFVPARRAATVDPVRVLRGE